MLTLISLFTSNPLGRYLADKLKYLALIAVFACVAAGGYFYYQYAQARTAATIAQLNEANTKLVGTIDALAGRVDTLSDMAVKSAKANEITDNLDRKAIAQDLAVTKSTTKSLSTLKDLHAKVKTPVVTGRATVATPDPNAEIHAAIIAELWRGYCDEINPDNAECGV